MRIGAARDALDQGKQIRRKGWNGKGLMVQLISDFEKMLPGVDFKPFMVLIDTSKDVPTMSTWAPSASDFLADDWEVL